MRHEQTHGPGEPFRCEKGFSPSTFLEDYNRSSILTRHFRSDFPILQEREKMLGYTEMASAMGYFPEKAILRGFKTLNMQNLLYYQAELIQMESELRILAKADKDQHDIKKSWYAHDWTILSNYFEQYDDMQWKKMLQIRTKLKEYSRSTPHSPRCGVYRKV